MGAKGDCPFTLAQPKAAIRHLLYLNEGEVTPPTAKRKMHIQR